MITSIKRLMCSVFLLVFVVPGVLYSSEINSTFIFDIEAGLLEESLIEFSEITGVKIFDPKNAIQGKKSKKIKGSFKIKAVMEKLLLDSGLEFSFLNKNEIILRSVNDKIETERISDIVVKDRIVTDEHKYLPSTLSLDKDFLSASNATDIKSSTRYIPGVSVFKAQKRGQSAGYCIRGMGAGSDKGYGENRIVMTIDGERLPDFFDFGHDQMRPMISGRNNVEFDTVKVLDVVKGPRAAAEGNDAIGGVVAFRTYSPEDFVDDSKKFYGGMGHGFRSENKENKTSVTLAAKSGNVSGMVIGTRTDAHETSAYSDTESNDIVGRKRQSADPQGIDGRNILGKINIGNEEHKLSLLGENYYYRYDTLLLGDALPNYQASEAVDTIRRERFSAEYKFRPVNLWFDEFKVKAYQQKLHNTDDHGTRNPNGGYTKGYFDQDINSVKTDFNGSFKTGNIQHAWSTGLEYRWDDASRMEWRISLKDGEVAKKENKKYLPDMSTKTYGGYLQYSMRFPFGLSVVPSVRYEKWEYTADETDDYINTVPDNGHKLASLEMDNTTIAPKILLNQDFTENLSMYFSFASGAKNPPIFMITGMVRPGHIPILPGVELDPEKTDNYEVGMVWKSKRLYAALSGYINRYEDMIGYSIGKSSIITGQMGFLPYNLKEVDIYGFEANIKFNFFENWFLRCLYSYSEGNYDRHDAPGIEMPLEKKTWVGIDPQQMILGLGYESDKFGGSIDWTMSGSVEQAHYGINTPGYGYVDMNCWFKLGETMDITAGIYNIFDREYWQSIDLIEETGDLDHPAYKRFTQPGRNFAVKVKLHF